MTNAIALEAPVPKARFDQAGMLALFGVAATLQFSIAISQILLTVAVLCWLATMVVDHEPFEVPRFFWPLVVYGALTLVSAAFSPQPWTSFVDCKQLVLFSLVPITYRFAGGSKGQSLTLVVVTFAAISAAIGIFEYAFLHYDHLNQRPPGTLGHYMTYSGLLMLVIAVALARVLFGQSERTWAALVIPSLGAAVAVTFTRSATVGACAAAALLFALKDFRLFALAPVTAAIFFGLAPTQVAARFSSMFDTKNATARDRVAMIHIGERMVVAHPLTGVGPNMVQPLYEQFRGPDAVNRVNPHLHNVPMQIAAERGLPALAAWLWFIVAVARDLWRRFKKPDTRFLAASGLGVLVALLTAGFFEYNFGDSEVLMLFLILITLPAAADHPIPHAQG
jgi:O-antigen ligase